MASNVDHKELQLEEDIKWTERSWIIQRIGWVLLLLFVLFAGLGVFGIPNGGCFIPNQGLLVFQYPMSLLTAFAVVALSPGFTKVFDREWSMTVRAFALTMHQPVFF